MHNTLINILRKLIDKFDFTKNQLDQLTGTWNKNIFTRFIEKQQLEIQKDGKPFTLVYFDIDNFVEVNEKYSHDAGDYILKEVLKVFKTYLREYDSISRWGGVKFLMLFPETTKVECTTLIKNLDDIINQKVYKYKDFEIKTSCTFGIYEAKENESIKEIIENTDKLLYKEKALKKKTYKNSF